MAEGKIIKMEPVSLYDVKEVIKERKAERELTYEQEITMKYVEKFGKLTEKQTKDLIKSLSEIEFLKDNKELVYQFASGLPTKVEQAKLYLPRDVEATDDELKAVVDLTKKFGDKI
jgi:DNA-directed RNA polymerase subunit F